MGMECCCPREESTPGTNLNTWEQPPRPHKLWGRSQDWNIRFCHEVKYSESLCGGYHHDRWFWCKLQKSFQNQSWNLDWCFGISGIIIYLIVPFPSGFLFSSSSSVPSFFPSKHRNEECSESNAYVPISWGKHLCRVCFSPNGCQKKSKHILRSGTYAIRFLPANWLLLIIHFNPLCKNTASGWQNQSSAL